MRRKKTLGLSVVRGSLLVIVLCGILVLACLPVYAAIAPNGEKGVCGPYYFWYQLSAEDYANALEYVDLCGIRFDIADLPDEFNFVYFEDTPAYQWSTLDKNHDGISDLFFLKRTQQYLQWQPESGCVRIFLNECHGNRRLQERCGYAAIRLQPQYGIREGRAVIPVHITLKCPPNGVDCSKEYKITHTFANCPTKTPLPDFIVQKSVNKVLSKYGQAEFKYTLIVQNTSTKEGVTALTDIIAEGSNGGILSLSEIKIEQCPINAECHFTSISNERIGVNFTAFPPNEEAKITYTLKGDSDEIPKDEYSYFTNTATLSNGNASQATIAIKGTGTGTEHLRRPERPKSETDFSHPSSRQP